MYQTTISYKYTLDKTFLTKLLPKICIEIVRILLVWSFHWTPTALHSFWQLSIGWCCFILWHATTQELLGKIHTIRHTHTRIIHMNKHPKTTINRCQSNHTICFQQIHIFLSFFPPSISGVGAVSLVKTVKVSSFTFFSTQNERINK